MSLISLPLSFVSIFGMAKNHNCEQNHKSGHNFFVFSLGGGVSAVAKLGVEGDGTLHMQIKRI